MSYIREFIDNHRISALKDRGRLKKLHNIYSGRRCFIIGGGPSIAKTNLTQLAGEITIGCNYLFLIFDKIGFIPTFYTIGDPFVAKNRAEQINGVRGTTKIFGRNLSKWLKRDQDTIYSNFVRAFRNEDYSKLPMFSEDFSKIVYQGGTIIYTGIQLAYYLGCREIYLVGVDHNYKFSASENNEIITSQGVDENHFHPDYCSPGRQWYKPNLDTSEKCFMAARNFGELNGMKIFNATIGGKLEIFPRVKWDDLFSEGN